MSKSILAHRTGLAVFAPILALGLASANYCLMVRRNFKKLDREIADHLATFSRQAG